MSFSFEKLDLHEEVVDPFTIIHALEELLQVADDEDENPVFENIFTFREDLNRPFDYDSNLQTGTGTKMFCAHLQYEEEISLEEIVKYKKFVSKIFVKEFIKLFFDKEFPDTPVEFPFSFKLLNFIKDQIAEDLEDVIRDYLSNQSQDHSIQLNNDLHLNTLIKLFKSNTFYIETKDAVVCILRFGLDENDDLVLEVNKLDSEGSS